MNYTALFCETLVYTGWGEATECQEPPRYRVWTKEDQSDARNVCKRHFHELQQAGQQDADETAYADEAIRPWED